MLFEIESDQTAQFFDQLTGCFVYVAEQQIVSGSSGRYSLNRDVSMIRSPWEQCLGTIEWEHIVMIHGS